MSTKNGRIPRPARNAPRMSLSDVFGNPLEVPKQVAEALTKQNKVWRWVSYRQLVDNGGHHDKGWSAVKAKDCGIVDTSAFGSDPDGYIRRGTLVLAVRSSEVNDKHKAYLKQEADRYSKVQSRHASELRQYAKAAGIDMSVSEGYGEEDSGD